MSNNKNWINDILDNAERTVRAWPEWMRRPEIRGTSSTIGESRGDVKEIIRTPEKKG